MEIRIFIGIYSRERKGILKIMEIEEKVLFGGIQWKKCIVKIIDLLTKN